MIVIDSNILIYAFRQEADRHDESLSAVRRLSVGNEAWLLTWQAIHEFISVVTHPKVYKPATPLPLAIEQVEMLMASPSVIVAGESHGYWQHFKRLALSAGVHGQAIYDVRLAAVGLSHGVNEILTNDSDFGRLESIRVRPL